MNKKKQNIVLNGFFKEIFKYSEEHKECFKRLVKRTQENGFSSLLVHPDFRAAHNRDGKSLIYIESTNLFYATNNPSGYIKRCIESGISPNDICAIKEDGSFENVILL